MKKVLMAFLMLIGLALAVVTWSCSRAENRMPPDEPQVVSGSSPEPRVGPGPSPSGPAPAIEDKATPGPATAPPSGAEATPAPEKKPPAPSTP